MAIDDGYSVRDLQDNGLDYTESQLCIPQDKLQDLELFPNFTDDFINLSDMFLTPEHKSFFLEDLPERFSDDFGKPFGCVTKTVSSDDFVILSQHDNYLEGFPVTQEQEIEDKRGVHQLGLSISNKNDGCSSRVLDIVNKKRRNKRQPGHSWSSRDPMESSMSENRVPNRAVEGCIQRRCSHCMAEKTPQWRMGPMGPKTLCNACGVRYKSGRLVEEYRPAASPTFDGLRHSNFHKRILKMKDSISEYR